MQTRAPLVFLGCALALLACAAPAAAVEELLDGIAAQVGSDVVLASEVTQITAPMEARMREAGASPSEIAKLRAEVLDRLIERRLIEQLVRRIEIDATEPEIDAAIAQIAQDNQLTVDELYRSVEAQGLDYTSYREQLRGEIQRTKVLNGVIGARVHVAEDDLRALYQKRFGDQPESGEEVHLRHIIVAFAGDGAEAVRAAREKTEAALARIRAGEPFEAVAREISDVSPENGGDVGWVHADALASWMASTVSALEPAQTSDPIRTGFGYNLLHLVDRKPFHRPSFEEVRDALERETYGLKLEAEYEEWIEKLRGQTYIERKGLFAEATRLPVEPADAGGNDAPGIGSP